MEHAHVEHVFLLLSIYSRQFRAFLFLYFALVLLAPPAFPYLTSHLWFLEKRLSCKQTRLCMDVGLRGGTTELQCGAGSSSAAGLCAHRSWLGCRAPGAATTMAVLIGEL